MLSYVISARRPLPKWDFVNNYVRAFYYLESDYLQWVLNNPGYTQQQYISVATIGCGSTYVLWCLWLCGVLLIWAFLGWWCMRSSTKTTNVLFFSCLFACSLNRMKKKQRSNFIHQVELAFQANEEVRAYIMCMSCCRC